MAAEGSAVKDDDGESKDEDPAADVMEAVVAVTTDEEGEQEVENLEEKVGEKQLEMWLKMNKLTSDFLTKFWHCSKDVDRATGLSDFILRKEKVSLSVDRRVDDDGIVAFF